MTEKRTVLLLGSGGREHALAWKLSQSPSLKNLYALPGSDAISQWAQNVPGNLSNPASVVQAAKDCRAKLVVIGPEAPLAAGVADALRAAGISVFGPGKQGARLESSKAFAKEFMARHGIPTAPFEVFKDAQSARSAAEAKRLPFVLKADGLAGGKGVVICRDSNTALGVVTEFMERDLLGAAGRTVLLEDCLEGPELSVLALTDGKTWRLLPAARDHKRLKDGDQGPNTGGMGAFAPVPLEPGLIAAIEREVLDKTVMGLRKDGIDFQGVLYAGLMLTARGPMVLEYNARFGDPETQALMPLLDCDLVELLASCAEGRLGTGHLQARPGACVTVVLASEGYPQMPTTGKPVRGLDAARPEGVQIFHSGTKWESGRWLTTGGRVLSVSALGRDLAEARANAYRAASGISFDGAQYRGDIAGPVPVKAR